MTSGKVILSLLVAGAAIGAAVRILFEPQKGKATRKSISEKGKACADELEETFNGYFDNIADELENIKEEAIRKIKTGKNRPEDAEMDAVAARK